MPSYDYLCDACGPFTEMRPMSESSLPQPCPVCGASSSRAFLRAPSLGGGASPAVSGAPASGHVHSGSCGCSGLRRNAFG
ncbi:zinc ribbon domain-containing protein [Azospirillum sp. SYSU D00513]|uniref:FmdB family zinc ribbon protein n=1 Tax=Azospirillum sp. SYSU D00513 TaxID=2812561 RepID=UPI001A95CECC|nr:zinc ribbon domain-containing protein [Azospirillum sp. SYSU D00513]